MKKVMMLASAAMMMVAMNSCSGDDNGGGGVSAAKLAGKWEHSTEKVTAAGQVLQAEQPYADNETGCAKDYIMFTEAGAITFGDYWSSDCDLDQSTGAYVVSGKEVTVSGGDLEADTFTVSKLSSNAMTVKYTETVNGVNFVYEYKFTKAAN